MNGRIAAVAIVVCAAVAGIAMYYLQVYGYYRTVSASEGAEVRLVSQVSGAPESIPVFELEAIDADSSPIRYRACFRTEMRPAELSESFVTLDAAAPRNAPRCGPTWAQPSVDGKFVYVACNRNAEVLEIDTRAWTVTRRFSTGAGPYNLDVSPDGRRVVVSYKGAQATGIIDLESGNVRAVSNTRRLPHGVAISPDSRYAFVSVEGIGGEPGTVDVIDLEDGTLAASVDMGKQAGGIGFWKYVPGLLRGERRAGG